MWLRLLVLATSATTLAACALVGGGRNQTPTPAPTATPPPTSTPISVLNALKAALLPEVDVGPEWSRIPANPTVSRFVGDDESLRSPCDIRGPVAVAFVAGEHLAGPKGSSDIGRPQWYETIAVFASEREIRDYTESLRRQCSAEGESVEHLFDPVGDASLYLRYGAENQIHRVLLVRRQLVLMQVRYDTYTLTDADEHRFEGLVRAADDRLRALTSERPDLGTSSTPTPTPSSLN